MQILTLINPLIINYNMEFIVKTDNKNSIK